VLTSHHAFADSNRLAADRPHLVYVHAPARYLWTPELDPRGHGWHRSAARSLLRRVDAGAARRVTAFAANSEEVAARVRRFWGRDATVIHPPVRVEFFGEPQPTAPRRDYILGIGRWIGYKNLHLVPAVGDRAGLPVKIAGRGPERARIVAAAEAARVPVEIVDSPSDAELRELYRNAAALVFPTIEDFGIVPVEAQAAGTPVVTIGRGGAMETVLPGESGVLTETLAVGELATAVRTAVGMDPEACRRSAARFSQDRFRSALLSWTSRWGVSPTV
jgi:glycosyltransferase involved in cell wall biosynthesis